MGATGTVQIEIQSLTLFDKIAVSGSATLGGTLSVTHLGGFTPSGSPTFQFMTFASRTGDFVNFAAPSGFNYPGTPGTTTYIITGQAAPPNVWVLTINGDWNVAANWSLNHVPTAGEDVVINIAGVTITISTVGMVARSLTSTDSVIVATGGTLTLANSSSSITERRSSPSTARSPTTARSA